MEASNLDTVEIRHYAEKLIKHFTGTTGEEGSEEEGWFYWEYGIVGFNCTAKYLQNIAEQHFWGIKII